MKLHDIRSLGVHISYLCLLSQYLAVAAFAEAPTSQVAGWHEIEQQLEKLTDSPTTEHIRQLPELEKIFQTHDANLFWEMVAQPKVPLVQLAGFEFLLSASDSSAYDAGADLVMSPDFPASLAFQVIDLMSNEAGGKAVQNSLDVYARAHPGVQQRWSMLICVLPPDQLPIWYNEHAKAIMPVTYRALLLDAILANKSTSDKNRELAKKEVARYRLIPGVPRSIYVLHADDAEPGFKDAITLALQDDTVPEITRVLMAVRKHDYIRNYLDWKRLKLSNQVINALNGEK